MPLDSEQTNETGLTVVRDRRTVLECGLILGVTHKHACMYDPEMLDSIPAAVEVGWPSNLIRQNEQHHSGQLMM